MVSATQNTTTVARARPGDHTKGARAQRRSQNATPQKLLSMQLGNPEIKDTYWSLVKSVAAGVIQSTNTIYNGTKSAKVDVLYESRPKSTNH